MNQERLAKFINSELKLSDKGVELEAIQKALNDYQQSNLQFTSDEAGEMWVEHGNPEVIVSGKGGKATLADVRRACGIGNKSAKEPTPWDSAAAKQLAEAHKLTGDEFPMNERTGRELKSRKGFMKVSIHDIRKKLGIEQGEVAYSSPGVALLAKEHNITPSQFNIKGQKIKKTDVEQLIKQLEQKNEILVESNEQINQSSNE